MIMQQARHYVWAEQVRQSQKPPGRWPPPEMHHHNGRLNRTSAIGQDTMFEINVLHMEVGGY